VSVILYIVVFIVGKLSSTSILPRLYRLGTTDACTPLKVAMLMQGLQPQSRPSCAFAP
jgi:hypothetical protein